MMYLKKIITSLLISFTTFILLLIINTFLCYFNIIKGTGITIFNLITPIISIFTGSFYIGNSSIKKGWLEGLKIGIIFFLIFILINILIYNSFVFKTLIYYSIILFASVLGGSIGISKKKVS